jgi:hypothetical protein
MTSVSGRTLTRELATLASRLSVLANLLPTLASLRRLRPPLSSRRLRIAAQDDKRIGQDRAADRDKRARTAAGEQVTVPFPNAVTDT